MKNSFLSVVCLLLCMAAFGQQKPETASGFVYAFELRGTGSRLSLNDHSEFGAAEWEVLPGYAINRRFSVFVPVTGSLGLFDRDEVKTYKFAGQLGLGAGYSPLHTAKDQLELSARVGCTLGGSWRFVYYDFGLRYGFGGYRSAHSIYLGAGVRYYDAFGGGGFGNYCNLYVALGFKFNAYRH